MKAKRQMESDLNSAKMLEGSGGTCRIVLTNPALNDVKSPFAEQDMSLISSRGGAGYRL